VHAMVGRLLAGPQRRLRTTTLGKLFTPLGLGRRQSSVQHGVVKPSTFTSTLKSGVIWSMFAKAVLLVQKWGPSEKWDLGLRPATCRSVPVFSLLALALGKNPFPSLSVPSLRPSLPSFSPFSVPLLVGPAVPNSPSLRPK